MGLELGAISVTVLRMQPNTLVTDNAMFKGNSEEESTFMDFPQTTRQSTK
jgi:hypothetical protein